MVVITGPNMDVSMTEVNYDLFKAAVGEHMSKNKKMPTRRRALEPKQPTFPTRRQALEPK